MDATLEGILGLKTHLPTARFAVQNAESSSSDVIYLFTIIISLLLVLKTEDLLNL